MCHSTGYWLLHCHISFHIEVGMGLVFKVGDESMLPPLPNDFPRCGSWQPTRTESLKSSVARWLEALGDTAPSIHLLPSVNGSSGAPHGHIGPSYATPVPSGLISGSSAANSALSSHGLYWQCLILHLLLMSLATGTRFAGATDCCV